MKRLKWFFILVLMFFTSSLAFANTIASSTMYFKGTLTDEGSGVYSGVLPMVAEGIAGIGDDVNGYDIYGKNGATANFSNDPNITISDNDAWPTSTPDTPDWYQYSLNLYEDAGIQKWAVRNHAGATESNPWSSDPCAYPARGVPMSGLMDWSAMYAAETDTGEYLPGMGTAKYPGWAASQGGGEVAWDMDWSWGSEVVPLEYVGFAVEVDDLGGGEYLVVMNPATPEVIYVDDDFNSSTPGWGLTHFAAIQDGVDAVVEGGTVNVAAGTYDGTLDIDGKTDLHIVGAGKNTTIIKSSTTIGWNVAGYGTSRQTVVRVVNSTNISLENVTIDGDLIAGNNIMGILGWDSSFTLDNSVVENMSLPDASGYYYEIGSYFRAPGYSDVSRANVTIKNSTFTDVGRVALVTHDYVNGTIQNNVFCKTIDDFGYGIEMGSQSSGVISDNKFYGFDTAALSDGSESAGIYIENSFTGTLFGGPFTSSKAVTVRNNEVYDCQYGIWIGNGYDGYAGDIDIVVTLEDNSFHDNVEGGAIIQDEDMEDGSSVSVIGGGNTWKDNNEVGLFIFTQGDGDITVDLSGEIITGHDYGAYIGDYGSTSTSNYSVAINDSSISGNTSYGIENAVSTLLIDADDNWWGDASGPYHPTLNPTGNGNQVSDYVDFDPYLLSDPTINILKLDAGDDPVYLNPDGAVGPNHLTIDMDALKLAQHVTGCQAILNFSSAYFLAGTGDVDVQPGGGIWDELIWSQWDVSGDLDVAVGVDLDAVVGTKEDGTIAKFTLDVDPSASDGTTNMVFRPDMNDVESTIFADMYANAVYPGDKIDSQDIIIDGTNPNITDISAKQFSTELTPSGTALQGTIEITVTASDDLAGLDGIPQVTVEPNAGPLSVLSGTDNGNGTYSYTFTVEALTNNGLATIEVTAADNSGNTATDSTTFYIDKNQVVVTVELQLLNADITRDVTFICTDSSNTVLKTETVAVDFLNSTNQGTATLTEAPADTAHISAKTAWNLRERLDVSLDSDGQASASFSSTDKLRGGDINGSNSINILDYSILRANYNSYNSQADINGDGQVQLLDYMIMRSNWFQLGDPE